jgi:hypothetical protein
MFLVKRSVAVVVDQRFQGDVAADRLSGWPGVWFLAGGPGEVDNSEGAVIDAEDRVITS